MDNIDEELRELILFFNSKGVKTYGCCQGHKHNEFKAYISFEKSEKNLKIIKKLVETLNKKKEYTFHEFILEEKNDEIIVNWRNIFTEDVKINSFFYEIVKKMKGI